MSLYQAIRTGCIAGALLLSSEAFCGQVSPDSSQTSRLRVTNECKHDIWVQSTIGGTPPSDINDKIPTVVKIAPNQAYDYSIPDEGLAATRFWPKVDCNEHGYDCRIGESTAVQSAQDKKWQSVDKPFSPDVNSKFEATWGCKKGGNANAPCAPNPSAPGETLGVETWWNGSVVDGFTLPYSIFVKNHNGSCTDLQNGKKLEDPGVDCSGLNAAQMCPTSADLSRSNCDGKTGAEAEECKTLAGKNLTSVNMQWVDPVTKEVEGCFSPCAKLTTAQGSDENSDAGGWRNILGGIDPSSKAANWYCCPAGITPHDCTLWHDNAKIAYETAVQTNHCDSYTYAYDDAKGLAKCSAETRFEVVFCSKPGEKPADEGGSGESNGDNDPIPLAQMKLIIPSGMNVLLDGKAVSNGASVQVKGGSLLELQGDSKSCVLSVSTDGMVKTQTGDWCSAITIDNNAHTLTFTDAAKPQGGFEMQFNYNPAFSIKAFVNDVPVENAQVWKSSSFPASSILKANQGDKWGACQLTIEKDNVKKGDGDLCVRLNIVKEASGKVHIYLPADIPNNSIPNDMPSSDNNTNPAPPVSDKYAVFSIDNPDIWVSFLNDTVRNGSKVALKNLNESQVDLIAHQGPISASCVLSKSGETLSIVPNSGYLCDHGLILRTQNNGDYFVGLPKTLPQAEGTKGYFLGLPQGMTVTLNGKVVRWDAPDKSVSLQYGSTYDIKMVGNSGVTRHCPLTLSNSGILSVDNAASGCVGVVENGGVLYFPAF